MKTSSAKAKGRRLQQRVRDDMRAIAGSRLDPSDIESTTMGLSGVDVILTKAARDLFGPLAFECKNVELLNAVGVFQKHYDKYAAKSMVPIMVHSRNHIEPRVTMLWADFVKLYLAPMFARAADAYNTAQPPILERRTTVPAIFAAPYGRKACCANEQRTFSGGCKSCGDPSF